MSCAGRPRTGSQPSRNSQVNPHTGARVDLGGESTEDVSMASQPASRPASAPTTATRSATRGPRRRTAEIDVDEARKAFFLMVGFIALIWVLQVVNWADHYHLDASYGILPRSLGHLGDIF